MGLFDFHFHDRGNAARDAKLDHLLARMETLMAKVDQLSAVIADINDATNRVAAKVDAELATIQALQAKLSSGTGVDPAELDPVLANLESVRNRLQGIGADPTNPVPEQPEAATDQPAASTTATEGVGSAPAADTGSAAPAGAANAGAVD